MLPQLSYRGRVLICNNLVASSLWHRMTILEPPEDTTAKNTTATSGFFLVGTALAEDGGAVSTQTRRRPGVIDIGYINGRPSIFGDTFLFLLLLLSLTLFFFFFFLSARDNETIRDRLTS